MKVTCYNCGIESSDESEWQLSKHGWVAVSKRGAKGVDWKEGESLDDVFQRIGHDWYCQKCISIGFDRVFDLPVRTRRQRN